jgi:hypothetical protein
MPADAVIPFQPSDGYYRPQSAIHVQVAGVCFSEFLPLTIGIKGRLSAWEGEALPLDDTSLDVWFPQIPQSNGVTSHGRVVEEWYRLPIASKPNVCIDLC